MSMFMFYLVLVVFGFLLVCWYEITLAFSQFGLQPKQNQNKIEEHLTNEEIEPFSDNYTNIMIWWTPLIGSSEYMKLCSDKNGNHSKLDGSFITGNRTYIHHIKLQAILFYGSNIDVNDLPVPRNPTIPWILFHEESPKNVAFLSFPKGIALFNWTATFSRHSTFPISPLFLNDANALLDNRFVVSVESKNQLQSSNQLASVVYIQSICDTMSGRDDYVKELMKYIKIDSYGDCLHNKDMPPSLTGSSYMRTIGSDEFYTFIARYKFVIAYENSVCEDYITEKLWRPLIVGVVPIYFGAPNVKHWLPNPKSAILINDFQGPRHLAEFLQLLNDDDKAYESYLLHKQQHISNEYLVNTLNNRKPSSSVFDDFECSVERYLRQSHADTGIVNRAESTHYNCALSALEYARFESERETLSHSNWQHVWKQAACEAEAIHNIVQRNQSYNRFDYEKELLRIYDTNVCQI